MRKPIPYDVGDYAIITFLFSLSLATLTLTGMFVYSFIDALVKGG